MFVHFSGTVEAFKSYESQYTDKIVFIKGGADGKGAAIYTHGEYYTSAYDIEALVRDLKIVKGVMVNSDQSTLKVASGHDGVINFTNGDETVAISADGPGIKISVSEAFRNRVATVETLVGAKNDAASASGSAFARIAKVSEDLAALTGSGSGSVADQIADLKQEITEGSTTTIKDIDEALEGIAGTWKDYVTKTQLSALAGGNNDGNLVKVEVASAAGEVTSVTVNEEALNTELGKKANADNVYTKAEADALHQALGQRITNEAPVTVTEEAGSGDILKTYVFSQNKKEIGRIQLAKDIVVKEGALVDHNGEKCIELTLNNEAGTVIHIPVKDLVDVYTGSEYVTVSAQNVISVDKAGIIEGLATDVNAQKYATDAEGRINKTLEAYETAATAAGKYVAKVSGQRLMTNAEGSKLEGIEAGAQVNKIESIEVNGVAATINSKKATVTVDCYTQEQIDTKLNNIYVKSEVYTKEEVDAMWAWEELQ